MKTFPKPLTVKEEKYYLQKYKEGDEEAKQILIERNLRLVAHVAKKYQHPDEDADDLISIGTVGLIKAVLTFDHTKNNRLAASIRQSSQPPDQFHTRFPKNAWK